MAIKAGGSLDGLRLHCVMVCNTLKLLHRRACALASRAFGILSATRRIHKPSTAVHGLHPCGQISDPPTADAHLANEYQGLLVAC